LLAPEPRAAARRIAARLRSLWRIRFFRFLLISALNAVFGYVQLMRDGIRGPVTEAQLTDLGRRHPVTEDLPGAGKPGDIAYLTAIARPDVALVNNIAAAAALGRLDLVAELYSHSDGVKPVLPGVYWIHLPKDFEGRNEFALVWACAYGRVDIVEFLLARGVNPAAANGNRMTCLHEAAAHGHMRIVDLLLERGAPLEVENVWGGTVLNSTLHFAFHMPYKGVDYPAMVARLVAAGADVAVVDMPTGNARIDQALVSTRRSS